MAMFGWQKCRFVILLLSVVLFYSASVIHATIEENSFAVGRHAVEEMSKLIVRDVAPCDPASEIRSEGYIQQRLASVASIEGASNIATGPCKRQTTNSCPVKCFRADPVCGTDKVTYWCGAADANCAGVEVAHDGYCHLWELDTNIGSTTALQSLQLLHMLWLVVAGFFIVLGLL